MATVDLASAGMPGDAADRRAARRHRVLKAAVAAINMEFSSFPCVVRNVSETGARLEFSGPAQVPPRFVLHVELDGFKVECERVWQRGNQCGVRFVSEKMPTRVHRTQVLQSSENALSDTFKHEMARREAMAQRPEPAPQPPSAPKPVVAPKPTFGKRV